MKKTTVLKRFKRRDEKSDDTVREGMRLQLRSRRAAIEFAHSPNAMRSARNIEGGGLGATRRILLGRA